MFFLILLVVVFQSTLPARGATKHEPPKKQEQPISIHAPRTGSDQQSIDYFTALLISIHAPRTGSDALSETGRYQAGDFNPRSPHGERLGFTSLLLSYAYFNPRSPHGERHEPGGDCGAFHGISIHAPRTGSDIPSATRAFGTSRFQSTLPARGATRRSVQLGGQLPHFNPRSPHGERPLRQLRRPGHGTISIHAPRTGSDGTRPAAPMSARISIHAPRTGSDLSGSRTSCRAIISIHAPRTGSDLGHELHNGNSDISIHAPRTGSDAALPSALQRSAEFQSTLPARGATRSSSRHPRR